MNADKLYQIALVNSSGIGSTNIKSLISYCGSAKQVFSSTKGKLSKIPGIGTITASGIKSNPDINFAEHELNKANNLGVELLFYTDKNYPRRLKQIADAPPLLYTTSNNGLNKNKIVAIVGTRKATDYGKGMVTELIQGLKSHDPTIVSGLAYGIDIQAHKDALKYNLTTIGVMASGLDIIYPAAHKRVAQEMKENGALISENAFGTKPDAPRFPARNRIIAGMVDVVIVIEAARKGGALITAEIANSYNKDVLALPGNAGSTTSEGCNHLIKSNKAHLLDKIEDIEYIMNWDSQIGESNNNGNVDYTTLNDKEKNIVTLFNEISNDLLIDDISWKSQITISEVSSVLLQLEFKGIIKSLPGKKYRLLN